ncbi:MAG: polysaccharide deacetylase family protein [Planctomycetota bacterium]|jgi:peptidoglycan/xylan/chitin deacetylase (PgdA/CDA1 family)
MMALWVILFIGFCVGLWYVLPMLVRARQVAFLNRTCREQGAIVLTYDDGPGVSLTGALGEVLGELDVRATFFVLECRARGNEDLLERMRDEGHELCVHGSDHPHAWKTLPWVTPLDFIKARSGLRSWTGESTIFRPPYGKWVLPTMILAWAHRARAGWWTHDSRDTKTPLPASADEMAESIVRDGGGVVLMHDFDRETPDSERRARYVVELTRCLIERAREGGLSVRTMGELLSGKALDE